MKSFALKFIDIMIGIVLGLGFQWWPDLREPWQYAAFIFAYLSIIDYWIDTAPALKKYPPKHELELMLDVAIMFALFLFIYSTRETIVYFLTAFIVFRTIDSLWILRVKHEYGPVNYDEVVVNTWLMFNGLEIIAAAILVGLAYLYQPSAFILLSIFIAARLISRVASSLRYKRVYFI